MLDHCMANWRKLAVREEWSKGIRGETTHCCWAAVAAEGIFATVRRAPVKRGGIRAI